MFKEFQLPNGKWAESISDINRFLKENEVAMASDYSDSFRKNVRYQQEKARNSEMKADFVRNYKRIIWTNE